MRPGGSGRGIVVMRRRFAAIAAAVVAVLLGLGAVLFALARSA